IFLRWYACAKISKIFRQSINPLAEEIWRNSRIRFTIFRDKDTRLLTFEKGCQFVNFIETIDNLFPSFPRVFRSTFMSDNEFLGLILPVTPSIGLSEPPHYWIDHVKDAIMFFYDNMRPALNGLREDVGTKCKEDQNYEKWMFNLRQIYLLGHFSRIHAEINDETLFKMQDYEC
ncbi:2434_t:CDS:2, partial [Dentiscutata erythropus]